MMNSSRSVPGSTTRIAAWLLAGFVAIAALPAGAQTVTRGPYLQMGTTSTQIVRWRTDVATDSRVRFGTDAAALTANVDVAAPTTEHIVTLTGLSPSTAYYYAIGTTAKALAGGDASHFFITAPPADTSDLTRVWVLGDAGTAGVTGTSDRQVRVRDAYAAWTQAQYTDLILLLGDNAYDNGTDPQYQAAVFDMYRSFIRRSNLWTTIGNHDTDQLADPDVAATPIFKVFSVPTAGEAGGVPSGSRKYYSFNFANIHFICLDSMTSDRSVNGPMLTWLAADLAANRQTWTIAFWHHPPYTRGSHNSDEEQNLIDMRTNALPMLEANGVDLVLNGHSHSYERSKLIGGHYGYSWTLTPDMIKDGGSGRPAETGAYNKLANAGRTVYVVAGSAGQVSGGTLDHPVMYKSINELGSLVLDVNGTRLDATFLRDTGEVADTFTITKPAPNAPPAIAITAPAAGARFTAPADITIGILATGGSGTIRKVDYYGGGTLLGTATTPPYTLPWRGVAAGAYSLQAKATTDTGALSTSSPVNVTVLPSLPAAAANYQGLWWKSPGGSESGWGINFAHQGDIIFATWFTYDVAGKPWWLIAELHKSAADVYSGNVATVSGPAFSATPWDQSKVKESTVGTMTVSFTGANDGTLAYTVNGITQTKAITRQAFGTIPACIWGAQPDLSLATNFQDLWWSAPAGGEAGWGVNLTHQGDIIFATWFTYDAAGAPWWLTAELHKAAGPVYSGNVATVTGPAFSAVPFDPAKVKETTVGTATVTFANGNSGSFAYKVSGVTQTKSITRQVFVAPGTVCQ